LSDRSQPPGLPGHLRDRRPAASSRRLHVVASPTFFFFNGTATTEIYTLSLHDALPIFGVLGMGRGAVESRLARSQTAVGDVELRSEEHTSELQSRGHLVCRLLLEKKNSFRAECLRCPALVCSVARRVCSGGIYRQQCAE